MKYLQSCGTASAGNVPRFVLSGPASYCCHPSAGCAFRILWAHNSSGTEVVLSRFSSGYLPHLRCHAFESERALAA